MPGPLALASSFDPAVAAASGAAIADEVKHKGNDLVHAPTVEPMRTPLAGRAFETFGEDPLLSARTRRERIKAIQRQGIIANVKHFAPNSQEGEQGVAAADRHATAAASWSTRASTSARCARSTSRHSRPRSSRPTSAR